jgi:CheY-like chemotaxis protein
MAMTLSVEASESSHPAGNILVVCEDGDVIQMLGQAVEQFALSLEVQRDAQNALEVLRRRKYEAVIVDLQFGDRAERVLRELRVSPANRLAVTFTIVGSRPGDELGVHSNSMFTFKRPLTPAAINLTLKAAYGLILRERRRYFRCPIAMNVTLRSDGGQEAECQTVNIGEGGIALKTNLAMEPQARCIVQFTLSGQSSRFEIESLVRWCNEGGCVGLQFLTLSPRQKAQLWGWLSTRFEETLPEHVAVQFRYADQNSI